MADEIVSNATPAAAQPVVTEAAVVSPTPATVETVIGESAPVVEAVKAETPVEAPVVVEAKPAAEPSLLTPDPKEPAKTETAEKPVEGEKKEDASQSDEPAPLPTYDAFTLPEGTTLEEAKLSEFTKQLGEFERTTNASHEEVQKLGQALVDKHIEGLKTALERQSESYIQEWTKKKSEWVNQLKSDPELGGNRFETTLREAKEFIKTHGGNQTQVDAFYNALKETGADAHPDIVRFIMNVKNSSTFKTPQQLAAPKPVSEPKSKIAKRYGSTT